MMMVVLFLLLLLWLCETKQTKTDQNIQQSFFACYMLRLYVVGIICVAVHCSSVRQSVRTYVLIKQLCPTNFVVHAAVAAAFYFTGREVLVRFKVKYCIMAKRP